MSCHTSILIHILTCLRPFFSFVDVSSSCRYLLARVTATAPALAVGSPCCCLECRISPMSRGRAVSATSALQHSAVIISCVSNSDVYSRYLPPSIHHQFTTMIITLTTTSLLSITVLVLYPMMLSRLLPSLPNIATVFSLPDRHSSPLSAVAADDVSDCVRVQLPIQTHVPHPV